MIENVTRARCCSCSMNKWQKHLHVTCLQSDGWAEYSDLDVEGEKGTMRLLDYDEIMTAAMHLKRLNCTRGCSESLRLRLLAQ
jgi:hypothetical protein